MNKTIYHILTVVLSVLLLVAGMALVKSEKPLLSAQSSVAVPMRVLEVVSVNEYTYGNGLGGKEVRLRCVSEKDDTQVTVVQVLDEYDPVPYRQAKNGDRILADETEGKGWQFVEYIRTDMLIWLGVAFAAFLILFGGIKGINTLVSLSLTVLSVFCVLVPAVIGGRNIYFWASAVCAYIIAMTVLIVGGANKKSFAAIAGCMSGVLLADVLTLLMSKLLSLTGVTDEAAFSLTVLNSERPVDLIAIIFASVSIGAVGAIMDVAMSVASALYELKQKADIGSRELFKSGIAIGRDMMGTMANTLVLAYVGGSLSATVLTVLYNSSLLEVMNKERIAVELMQALIGSIGILFTIPFTCLICALLYKKNEKTM